MADHATPQQRAVAVGRVLAGESRRKVARELGVSDSTVRRWIKDAQRDTARGKKLAADAAEVRDDIEERLVEARDKLLARLLEVTPTAKGVHPLSIAFGVISDKLALARGEPTDRHEHLSKSDFDREVEGLVEKVKAQTNGTGPKKAHARR